MLEMRRPVYVEEKDKAVTNKTSKCSIKRFFVRWLATVESSTQIA